MSEAFESMFAAVPKEAHALRLFRVLPSGEPRCYSATTFPADPYRGCERSVRTFRFTGQLGGDPALSYGLLEAIDVDCSILADWPIPNARAFAYIKKRLQIVVVPTPDQEGALHG